MAKKTDELVEHLLEKTRNGDIEWEVSEDGVGFFVEFSESTIRIDNDGEFFIFDDDGNTIENVKSKTLPYSNLFEAVRRYVLKVDDLIDGIMDELGN